MLFEAGCQLAGLEDSSRFDLHSGCNVFKRDLFVRFKGARCLQDHVDGGTGEGLRLLALSNLQTRQIVRGDLACIHDIGWQLESVASVLGDLRRVKSSLVLRKEELYLVVALSDVFLGTFREGKDLFYWFVRIGES